MAPNIPFCSPFTDELDLVVTDFDVLPLYKELIISLPMDNRVLFDYTFNFAINKGPTSTASDPASFKYKLVMSAEGRYDDPTFTQVRESEVTITDMATTTVTGKTSTNTGESHQLVIPCMGVVKGNLPS